MSGTLMLVLCVAAGCRDEPVPKAPKEESAVPVDPMVTGLMARAEWAEGRGAYTAALSIYSTIHRQAPNYAPAHFRRALVLADLHRYGDAETALERTLELDPDFEGIHFALGNNAAQRGRFGEALLFYQEELERGVPGDDVSRYRAVLLQIARAHKELGEVDEALTALHELIELDAGFAEAHDELGAIYEDSGDLEAAFAARKTALDLDPENGDYAYFVGALLVRLGRAAEAIPYLEQARTVRPWFYGIYYNLGRSLMASGADAEGERNLAMADSLQNIDAELGVARATAEVHATSKKWLEYGRMLVEAERLREALNAYNVALSLDPADSASAAEIAALSQRLATSPPGR